MKILSLMSYLLVFLLFGCSDSNSKGDQAVHNFVKQWNDSHTQLKVAYLERDYMDVVTYYGKEFTKTQVQEDKNLLFEQFPDYRQRILNDELVITKEAGNYLVTFTTRVNYNGIEADYSSYLSVIHKNNVFKILREGLAENDNALDAPIFPNARKNNESLSKKRKLYGDFNGDNLSDYAYVISPEVPFGGKGDIQSNTSVECKGDCNSVVVFSDKTLKPITVNGVYQSQLENLKDLNSDGADEIGFWDIKPTTKSLYVFDATTSNLLSGPIVINTTIHKNLSLIDVFKKTGPNKITISYSAQVNGKWILKSEVVVLD
ncbi:hypothetical protein [Olleya sp. HaHaR_3_96]|uniref:hypothetical protein n=1 Tax=Olleya sp. HaHaR_3_96 TaxID=2745560 RepID=UPI001C4FFC16|nr:hypothetical protein [Olleya sp. HaHaR_3_96]QXP58791.1 hypothetical protein H0I26_12820 [Olleya sp. HaHaR_3_96]